MATIVRHHGSRRRLAAVGIALVAGGCAGVGAARRVTGTVRDGQFSPGRAPLADYGPAPGLSCPAAGAFKLVVDELADAAKRNGRTPLEADGRACAVAEALLGWEPAAGTPRPAVLAFASHAFGLPVTVQPPSIAVIETEDVRIIAERVVQSVGKTALNMVYPRFGMATQRVRRDATRVVVVLVDGPVQLDPLPRRLELGQAAKLSGRLLGGVKDPKVFVSDATGRLSTPAQPAGTEFQAEVRCGDRPGRIQVEIRGEYEGTTGSLASFPVACGEPLPTAVAVAGEPWPSDPASAEKKILDVVNGERTSAGLKPLKWDPPVASVARSISQDLAARAGAPGGPDVGERLKAEGIASPLILQSAVAERTFERAQARLLASPSNRANIMNAEATNGGVGAVTTTDAEGRPLVYVTEVFIKELPPVDVAKARDDLRAAVARKRKDARAPPLKEDPTLDQVAQAYAEALAAAGGSLPKDRSTEITAPLNRSFRTVTMVSGAKQELLDFAEEPQVTSSGKSLGVGVAQGAHPVLGRNAVYVVLMVGTPKK